MQPLDGAYHRVRRAGKHLANLKRRADAFCQVKSDAVVIERKPETFLLPDGREVKGVLGSASSFLTKPIPPIISILVGEIVYNLRAALDYLIYELARFDAGKVIKRTQFPIDNSEDCFRGRRKTFLKGLSDVHITATKRLQPCDGCDWTRTLKELSNPDKHMHLTVVSSPVTISLSQGSTEAIIAGQDENKMEQEVKVINIDDVANYIESYYNELRNIIRALEEIKEILQRIERKT